MGGTNRAAGDCAIGHVGRPPNPDEVCGGPALTPPRLRSRAAPSLPHIASLDPPRKRARLAAFSGGSQSSG